MKCEGCGDDLDPVLNDVGLHPNCEPPTLDDIKEEIRADLIAVNRARPRSKQVHTGASQIHGCRAATVLRLNGAPEQRGVGWKAEVGTAIDRTIGAVRKQRRPWVLDQLSLTYRGVPATIDELDPRAKRITDWKSKNDAHAIAEIADGEGFTDTYRAQVHLGAAAAIEAGYEVETVQLCYIPRNGEWEDVWVFAEPFNREIADSAVEYVNETDALSLERGGMPWRWQAEGLRDQPPTWCYAFCGFYPVCRGEEPPTEVDAFTKKSVREYLDIKARMDQDKARLKVLAEALEPFHEVVLKDGNGLMWVGGNKGEEVDSARVLDEYKALFGELPTRPTVSPRYLRRIKRSK